jgi:hypothetical protein
VGGQPPALAALNGDARIIVPIALARRDRAGPLRSVRTAQAVILPLSHGGLSVVWAMGIAGGARLT